MNSELLLLLAQSYCDRSTYDGLLTPIRIVKRTVRFDRSEVKSNVNNQSYGMVLLI